MNYLSVCSGIEAASVAWKDFGWKPVAFSEIDPFANAVLAHRFPTVANWGDMTRFKEWPDAQVDLLVGGTPCQSFSVAGLRKGLDDPRGSLMLGFLAIVERYRPRWLLWENVQGVLSSNGGRDFGAFVWALGQLGYGWSYRVLDARGFGVPQRRRRVFVVGCARDRRSAAQVLLERESVCRVPAAKRGEDGQAAGVGHVRCLGCGIWWEPDAPLECCPMCGALQSWAADVCGTLSDGAHMGGGLNGQDAASGRLLVHAGYPRRLTPLEAERLQGFPDGWTAIPYRGRSAEECMDGPRYRAIGNTMAVPVMRWIGERVARVHENSQGVFA